MTESHDILFAAGCSRLTFDDCRRYFAQAAVRETDDSYIFNGIKAVQEIFDLYRINIFSSGNDDIFFTVDKVDEVFFVFHGHVSGKQPSVF